MSGFTLMPEGFEPTKTVGRPKVYEALAKTLKANPGRWVKVHRSVKSRAGVQARLRESYGVPTVTRSESKDSKFFYIMAK